MVENNEQGGNTFYRGTPQANHYGGAVPPLQGEVQQSYTYTQQHTQQQVLTEQMAEQTYEHGDSLQNEQNYQQANSYPQSGAYPQTTPEPVIIPGENKSGSGKAITFLVGLLGVIVGAALSVAALYVATSGFSFSGTVDTSGIVIEPLEEDTELAEAVAAKVTPSVVNIDVYATQDSSIFDEYYHNGSDDASLEQTGLGSGVILTEDGYIVTNNHVIEGAERLVVSIGSEQFEAQVVGTDPSSDLAVIKVEATGLTPIEVGDSDDVAVGEWVMAVGSPFGLEKSVSTGIVSALYRSTAMQSQQGITIYANLIQTDAAINPGNSGGALVNNKGELIGINTLINSTSGSNSGVGFALPINYAFSLAEKMIAGQAVEHPYLGVTLYSVDQAVANELGLSVQSGAYINSVENSSPASAAGLQEGDVITSVNGTKVNTSAELIIEIRQLEIGAKVTLRINRYGEDIDLNVTLGSAPVN